MGCMSDMPHCSPAKRGVVTRGVDEKLNMVCNPGMNKPKYHPDANLIDTLGGPTELARKLGYETGGSQRVQNWKYRGIPEIERLRNPDIFGPPPGQGTNNTTS